MEIRAGQIWSQKEVPCHIRYVSIIPVHPDLFILLSDPRQEGSTVCTEQDGAKWHYTPEQLEAKFERLRYTCDGQLRVLLANGATR